MRLVLRILFFEFALSWALVLAGWICVAARVRPFLMGPLRAGVRRALRVSGGLLVGVPAVGWPLLFRFSSVWAADAHKGWLNVAIPWWLLLGVCGSLVVLARVCEERPLAGTDAEDGGDLLVASLNGMLDRQPGERERVEQVR
jgi:hypothetical protein